jgi:hypothetical protein
MLRGGRILNLTARCIVLPVYMGLIKKMGDL